METTGDPRCRACATAMEHCHETLVLHADGTLECERWATCGGGPAGHEWWVTCTELEAQCGCTGDEQPLVTQLARAA